MVRRTVLAVLGWLLALQLLALQGERVDLTERGNSPRLRFGGGEQQEHHDADRVQHDRQVEDRVPGLSDVGEVRDKDADDDRRDDAVSGGKCIRQAEDGSGQIASEFADDRCITAALKAVTVEGEGEEVKNG